MARLMIKVSRLARQLGADGFTVFNLGAALGDKFLPGLRSGITAEPTYVPHHGPRLTFQLSGTPDGKQRAVRVMPGEAVRCTIRRLEPKSASFAGTVVVENPDGDVIRELGRLDSSQAEAEFSFTLEPVGLYRVAVRGEAAGPGGGPKRPFTARSQGLLCGPLDPAMAANSAQAKTLAMPSPPGMRPIQTCIAAYRSWPARDLPIAAPFNMKRGIDNSVMLAISS